MVVAAILVLSAGCMLGLSGCGRLPFLDPPRTPTPEVSPRNAEVAKGLVARTLGPYPAYRPAQGNCYTIMTRPFVVPVEPSSPGDDLPAQAVATYMSNGRWLIRWSGGEWQVDEPDGPVVPLNSKATTLEETSKLPCPDQP